MIKWLLFVFFLLFFLSSIAQDRKVYALPGSYITPDSGLSWNILKVSITDGMYQIKINDNTFPKQLTFSDTIFIPNWISEQE